MIDHRHGSGYGNTSQPASGEPMATEGCAIQQNAAAGLGRRPRPWHADITCPAMAGAVVIISVVHVNIPAALIRYFFIFSNPIKMF